MQALLIGIWALGIFLPVSAQGLKVVGESNLINWSTASGMQGLIESLELQRLHHQYISKKSDYVKEITDSQWLGFDMSTYCSVQESKIEQSTSKSKTTDFPGRPQVGLRFEVDYQSFVDQHSDVNQVLLWVASIFENVESIYNLHHIDLSISEIKIWDIPDPYVAAVSPYSLLQAVGQEIKNDYSGHAVQFLTTRNIGGGRANMNAICADYNPVTHFGPYSVATGLSSDLSTDTIYNWNSYIVAHELGHVFGSPHTHACFWGSNGNQALDNCFASEGGCDPMENPPSGSIMSYCYNKSMGINFSNGLGSEPGAYVLGQLSGKPCVTSICAEDIFLSSMIEDSVQISARDRIESTAQFMHTANASLSAGLEIQLLPGTEIEAASQLTIYTEACVVNE